MSKLFIDIETYSPEPIADTGVYKYAMHRDFDILLVAYAFDAEPTAVVDLARGEKMPSRLLNALTDESVTKVAHNATFERVCLTMWLRRRKLIGPVGWLDPSQWDCTMVRCAMAGLPLSLAEAGKALGLEQRKMTEGKALIKKFCAPSKVSGLFASDRVWPDEAPEDWETFKAYCVRDVDVERAIFRQLDWVVFDSALYALDQHINDRGVLVDLDMVKQAAKMDAMIKASLMKEAQVLTGLSNPNSVGQLRVWLEERLGEEVETLRKTDVMDIAASTQDTTVRRVMEIRQQAGKTSNAKYSAMLSAVCEDGRVRGLLQYYGSRTGRWAGRLVQLQNLPQNHLPLPELAFARSLVKEGDFQTLQLCFGNVADTLSQLIRTALIAPEGNTFAVCDFSAIEARVLAWLAGEEWVLDTFRQGGDIYCATASQMFHVLVEKHGRNADLRQKGKIAVLALGYGGGVNALDKMGGQRLGMTEDEEKETVDRWRAANKRIVAFWKQVETAAIGALSNPGCIYSAGRVAFTLYDRWLLCQLPCGRHIAYPDAKVGPGKYGDCIHYHGIDQATNKWVWLETFGGKLVENITQAVARDCLADVLQRIDLWEHFHIKPVFHVHDEVICEVVESQADKKMEALLEIFEESPLWAEGLPLRGAGYTTKFYLKD